MTANRYGLVIEGLRIQLLHAYIKYDKGFGDRVLWQPWTTPK